MRFNDLLTKASVWDRYVVYQVIWLAVSYVILMQFIFSLKISFLFCSYQLRICYQLFICLCRDCPTNEETADFRSQYCFACMEYLSSSFNGKGKSLSRIFVANLRL